ncbi:hypothetical protein CANINC_000794 [Pichia inconspicua]|uniref:Uncharacterized protein n=1 Tax=Pichia inconspicua TaxID=52247 RepID=A0A4T0X5C7_9ASCO|nr:hypothetical protein CANINC_000794 [[Candida] inconspicua]
MNSSIIILDSDEENGLAAYDKENISKHQMRKNPTDEHQNDDFDDFADITAPDDNEDTFLHSLGLPTISAKSNHCQNPEQASSAHVICIDDEDEAIADESFIDLSNINDFPSSPKVTDNYCSINSSDEEIIIDSNRPKSMLELTTNICHSTLHSIANSSNNTHLKHLPKDWSNKPKGTKRTRSESDVTSSSIGIIHVPSHKPQYIQSPKTSKSQLPESFKSPLRDAIFAGTTNRPSKATSKRNSHIVSPLIRSKEFDRSFSEPSDITSSIHDASLDFTNDEIKQMKKAMKMREKQKLDNVKTIISDLRNARSGKASQIERNPKTSTKAINTSVSDISNTLVELKRSNDMFMQDVFDSVGSYTDAQLELMFEKAKLEDPQALRKVNQTTVGKDALTARTTCCFSSCLDESLKKINSTYHNHIKPAHFEVFEDHIIPMIKFKRYIDAVYYKAKCTMVPCKPKKIWEDFVILVYEAENLLDMFDRCIIQKHIKSIKMKNPQTKFAVWILKYDQYLSQLKNKANRLHKRQVMESLEPTENITRKRRKKSVEEELLIHPSDIVQKLLKYEIQYDFSFQSLKGLSDLIDWLIAIAYTLSSKHVDYIERNDEFMNLGKVKSGTNAKDCLTIMMSQIKGITEQRGKSFVTNGGYSCIGEVFEDVMKGVDFTAKKLLRTDHVKILEKLMKASSGDQAI